MCTPIVIDDPKVDLSKDGVTIDPASIPAQPAGTGVAAPGPTTRPGLTPLTPVSTDADGATTKVAEPGPGSGDPTPRVVIDPASAGPDGAINADPITPMLASAGPGGSVNGGPGPKVTVPSTGPTETLGTKDPANPTDPVQDQNTLLINSLTELAHHVTDTTAGILGAQTDAANALKSGFLDLNKAQQDALTAADQLRKNTGQASRKPSYSLSLAKNARANSGGVGSTMLTGSGGVPTNSLALGRAQLLGGAA